MLFNLRLFEKLYSSTSLTLNRKIAPVTHNATRKPFQKSVKKSLFIYLLISPHSTYFAVTFKPFHTL